MASGIGKPSHVKLWIVFGLFIGLIIGLIIYEVRVYIKAKEQRENVEDTRMKMSKSMRLVVSDTTSIKKNKEEE